MRRRVLEVGNCWADHAAIRSLLKREFGAEVDRGDGLDDTVAALRKDTFALVLVNRKLDRDGSDGLKIIQAIKSDPDVKSVPVMMITNYDDHQQQAVAAGAEWGFGKSHLGDPATVDRLRPFLT
jgi:CheY-like chemotaxis protein